MYNKIEIGVRELARIIEVGIILSTKEEYIKTFSAYDMYDMSDLCVLIHNTWRDKPCEEFKNEDYFGYITEWMNFDVESILEIIEKYKEGR